MPYIGRSTDGFGVRNRFIYLATSGATSVSGADANGATLTFTDGAFVDVYLNGVLLKPTTDYNTSTANTIAGLSALNTSDEVTVVVYDVFSVSDSVSASNGGTFAGNVVFNSDISVGDDVSLASDSAVINFGADSDVTLTHVADTGLRLANPTGADFDLTTNSQAGTSGSPLNMDLNFRGYNNNVMAMIRSHDESSSTGHGELQFHITKNSVGTREALNIDHDGDVKVSLGDIVFGTAGKGINLGVTSNTDSNTLDDYEEGTFTALYKGAGGSAGSAAGNSTTGHYVKIGDLVQFSITGNLTNVGSWTGDIQVTGLPFTAGGNHNYGVVIGHHDYGSNTHNYVMNVTANQAYLYLANPDSSTPNYQDIVATGPYHFNGFYRDSV